MGWFVVWWLAWLGVPVASIACLIAPFLFRGPGWTPAGVMAARRQAAHLLVAASLSPILLGAWLDERLRGHGKPQDAPVAPSEELTEAETRLQRDMAANHPERLVYDCGPDDEIDALTAELDPDGEWAEIAKAYLGGEQ
jgi:hypothetical protein